MKCVVCNQEAGYNRVVVDVSRGAELGGLCIGCERDRLGAMSQELGDRTESSCLFCERDGLWALPKWRPRTDDGQHDAVSCVEYDARSAALTVCDEHLARLGVDEIPRADPEAEAGPERALEEY